MTSTGNDIISLAHVNAPRTRQKQFYNKILSDAEVALYNTEVNNEFPFEVFVWLAWSVKESAFKYQQRHNSDLLFSPRKIIISSCRFPAEHCMNSFGDLHHEASSFQQRAAVHTIVQSGKSFLHAISIIHSELIYTVVNKDESFQNVWWGVKSITSADHNDQSAAVRSFLLNKLHCLLPGHHLYINKSTYGYPQLFDKTGNTGIPVSFTHDHNLVAYSFLLDTVAYQENRDSVKANLTAVF